MGHSVSKILKAYEVQRGIELKPGTVRNWVSKIGKRQDEIQIDIFEFEKDIQKKINVDNLLIIWTPVVKMTSGMGMSADVYEIPVIGQFFSFPGPVEIGRCNFNIIYCKGLVIGVKIPRNVDDFFRLYGKGIANEIAKSLKKSK
jgi:hypothetical protein